MLAYTFADNLSILSGPQPRILTSPYRIGIDREHVIQRSTHDATFAREREDQAESNKRGGEKDV
jgi:hypothetical protein